jgi:hypothetical protein
VLSSGLSELFPRVQIAATCNEPSRFTAWRLVVQARATLNTL